MTKGSTRDMIMALIKKFLRVIVHEVRKGKSLLNLSRDENIFFFFFFLGLGNCPERSRNLRKERRGRIYDLGGRRRGCGRVTRNGYRYRYFDERQGGLQEMVESGERSTRESR